MAEKYKPAEDKNWQQRQYDSYGPHFRIETADPRPGMCGPCLLYTSPSPRDERLSRMPSSA